MGEISSEASTVVEHGRFFDYNPDVLMVGEDRHHYFITTQDDGPVCEDIAFKEAGITKPTLLWVNSRGEMITIKTFLICQEPDHDSAVAKIAELEIRHGSKLFRKWMIPYSE